MSLYLHFRFLTSVRPCGQRISFPGMKSSTYWAFIAQPCHSNLGSRGHAHLHRFSVIHNVLVLRWRVKDGHAIDALNLDEYRISELQHQSRLSNWSGSMAHSAKTAPNLGASFSSSTIRASAPTLPPPHHTLTLSMILSPDY
ncbi:hypothetical protein NC653_020471 [Populus alba x Populus x berolinensis]|uniref:Uncharacterized protein n=1 Tax=Populus alba x Populus x berolinensis TaxID=444605 RepID=A0AAD6MMC6_9ROSI|nr:hypothetical protein NC653_020471 [Populus alba x Populus x berolinensis]